MTDIERENMIGAWLRDHILPRYRLPEHLDDTQARREVADMVSDCARVWPAMRVEDFAAASDRVSAELRRTHTARTWPTIAQLVKAISVAARPPQADATSGIEPDFIFAMVLDWWVQFRGPFPSLARWTHAARIVAAGHATWGQLWRAGFPIPFDRIEDAKAERDPDHERILADIRAMGDRLRGSGVSNPAFRRAAE